MLVGERMTQRPVTVRETEQVEDALKRMRDHHVRRLPVVDKKIIDVNEPQRGEVMVFHFPEDPAIDWLVAQVRACI